VHHPSFPSKVQSKAQLRNGTALGDKHVKVLPVAAGILSKEVVTLQVQVARRAVVLHGRRWKRS